MISTDGRPASREDMGLSLVELLIAVALAVVAGMIGVLVLHRAVDASRSQPDTIDMQGRARLGAHWVLRTLYEAGAGPETGPLPGPLGQRFPPVVPRRIGALNASLPDRANDDVVSLVWVPETAIQLTLATPLVSTSANVAGSRVCPVPGVSCSIAPGTGLLAFDETGAYDLFTVSDFSTFVGILRPRTSTGHTYPAGRPLVHVETRTFYFDAAARQLRQYDGDLTDVPVLDDVTGFRVEYFGTSEPPTVPRPPIGTANCLYNAAGVSQSGLGILGTGGHLVPLPLTLFTDGPWCGEGATTFDVDSVANPSPSDLHKAPGRTCLPARIVARLRFGRGQPERMACGA